MHIQHMPFSFLKAADVQPEFYKKTIAKLPNGGWDTCVCVLARVTPE